MDITATNLYNPIRLEKKTSVVQPSDGIVAFDPATGKIREVNAQFCSMLGYTADELTQMTIYDIVDDKKENVMLTVGEAIRNDTALFGVQRYRQKDGGLIYVERRLNRVCINGQFLFIGNVRDVTERKKAEQAIESENKLRNFTLAITDMSFILDADGRFIEVFGHNEKLMPRPKQELLGLTLYEVFAKDVADIMIHELRLTVSSGLPRYRCGEIKIGRQKVTIEARTAPMDYLVNGKKTVAVVVTDITEQTKNATMHQITYELRRKSDLINDIIIGQTVADAQTINNIKTWGIDLSMPMFCCLVVFDKASGREVNDDRQLKNEIIGLLSSDMEGIFWDCHGDIGGLCQVADASDGWAVGMNMAAQLTERINRCVPNLPVTIGLSEVHQGLSSIKKSYQQARSAVTAARCQGGGAQGIFHYRDIGIYQLLASFGGKEQTMEFVHQKIGRLIDYDREKGTDFLPTLEEILQSTNLKEAADKMFIHHKTLVFRKQRIEKILGISIDQFETRLALATAIKLYKVSNLI